MARMVNCAKLGRELPGLNRPPFGGALGKRVFENISQEAWALWQDQSTLVINHYALNLRHPPAQKFLMEQMEQFFFCEGPKPPEDCTPETQSAPSKNYWR